MNNCALGQKRFADRGKVVGTTTNRTKKIAYLHPKGKYFGKTGGICFLHTQFPQDRQRQYPPCTWRHRHVDDIHQNVKMRGTRGHNRIRQTQSRGTPIHEISA